MHHAINPLTFFFHKFDSLVLLAYVRFIFYFLLSSFDVVNRSVMRWAVVIMIIGFQASLTLGKVVFSIEVVALDP